MTTKITGNNMTFWPDQCPLIVYKKQLSDERLHNLDKQLRKKKSSFLDKLLFSAIIEVAKPKKRKHEYDYNFIKQRFHERVSSLFPSPLFCKAPKVQSGTHCVNN